MQAASSISVGMFCNPARKSSMCNPKYFQVRTTNRAGNDYAGVAQPRYRLDSRNENQNGIDKAAVRVGIKKAQPNDSRDNFGNNVRHEEDRAEKRPAGQIAPYHDCQR